MKKIFTLCLVLCMSYLSMGATNLKHEFRATWLTTAWGNDWPKTKVTNDATRKQQQDSLIAIFDRLQAGNMNAVCMQVRGRSDAFYQSSYEPWAAELAGARGTDPGYDPLAFAIKEAHKRGLELHAWVNPFRVTSAGTLASTDLVKKNAGQWIIQYNNGSFTGEIIDPGYPEAREYVLNVLMEIISNYDIDGIVMDDYFYPYGGTTTEDAASKALHKPANVVDVNQDGDTDDDWRRSNVDVFLKEFYNRIQTTKPWVRLGMGTFGIWTTQSKVAQAYGIALPSGISGLDDYDEQACNPVEWVKNGYVDYINPQLYWPTTSTRQNYNKLCQWWAKDVCEHFSNQLTNGKKVHFFSSQSISSNSAVSEIQAEIDANRSNLSSGYTGSVFFDTDAYLTMDKDLMTSRFATNALTPPMDWKSKTALFAPTNLTISGTTLTWQHATAERFTVYVYPKGTAWSTAKNDPAYLQGVIYGKSMDISGIDTNANDIAVCAYDRFGVEHETAIYGATPGDVTPPASGTITYELNGGVQSSYLTAQDMYADLNVDYNAATGATAAWLSLAECTATNQGIPTAVASMDVTFFTAAGAEKWGWLATYVDKVSADQAVAVASSSSASMRYNLQSFFKNWQHTGWPKSADYTTCGVSTLDAYQPYWKSSFANPTEPTAEVTLYAPYKEGYTFAGWYTNADFSGEKVTKIDANTTGTLYAKWVEYIPTIAEVKALADDVVTNVSGVVNHIQGKNVYIQDATGGIHVYTSEDPTCKVGDKIVAKGVKASYGGAPEVKNAVINTTEAGTLAPSQTFEGLSELVADMKHFATRVTVPGLKIVSYDGYNNPTVTDGVNEALCYRMPLDPAQFPIGSKITITAVAGWYNGFQFVGDVAGIELVVVGKKDKYEYPVRNSETSSYTLINDWVISNNEDNFAANAPGRNDYVRGMAVKDGIMYFINRDTKSIVPVVGATAEMLDPIAITGEHLFERIGENGEWESACKLPFNDIKFDQAGNCLIGSCVSGDGTFQIYLVDLETGAATLVVEERLYDNPDFLNNGYRFDAFGVAGDVTQNGVIMAADATSGSWNVYRWLITDGEVAPAEQITMLLDPEYDQSLFIDQAGWGTGPQIFPKDEIGSLFYVDGFNMLPMLFDEGGMLVDDFINCPTQKEVTNKDGDVLMMNTGHNGLVEFQVGDEYFLLMAAGNTAAAVPSCFALFKFADEGCTFDGLEPLWYFPANGMGTLTNGCRTAVPSVEVVDDKTANLYLYTNNNGYARYTLNIGDATSINGITYELNGGVTNDYGWQSKADMWEAFKIDAGITTLASLDDLKAAGEGSLTTICTPLGASQCQAILDTTKWDWLEAYIMNHQNADAAATKLTEGTSSAGWRYALAAFFLESQRTGWPKSADFSKAGKDEAYIPTWRHAFDNPTNPAEEFVLNAPYKEGYTFAGWYTNADFSGEKVTTINAETTGTLYAKWIDETWQITYTSSNDSIVTPYKTDVFGANIVSNTYENGVGTITFDGPVTSIGSSAFYDCSSLLSVTIPNSVTSIGGSAFYDCSSLTSVTISESVTSIGNYAFCWCSSLTSVTIPNSVTSIGEQAFINCRSLTSVTIPNSVTSIGEAAFSHCASLTSMVVEPGNTTYDSRENCNAIIEKATNTLIAGCQNTTIPNSVTSIGEAAFSGCTSLTSITIPNSVTNIGESAFSNCSGLTSIVVENGNAVYDSRDNCNAIIETPTNTLIAGCQNTIIPNSVTSIGDKAFAHCNALTSITIPESVTSIGGSAFYHCASLTSVTLGSGVTSIGGSAFYHCASLTSVTLGSGVTSIGGSAFNGCSSLTSVTIPNSVTSIGLLAFYYCTSLTSITIPNSVTSIEFWAFRNCTSLTSITCNATTPPTLGLHVFPSELTTAYIPCGTKAAYEASDWASQVGRFEEDCVEGQQIFYTSTDGNIVTPNINAFDANIVSNIYENGVGTITFEAPITSIGDSAFYQCKSLASITIPNSVTSIGKRAFHSCYSLTSVTIPNSVTSIGNDAFYDCDGLISITIPNSVTSIGGFAFGACSSITSITIPNSVVSIKNSAFAYCSSLISISIPSSVTSIGERICEGCSSLISIVVEESNKIYDSRMNCNAIIETATNTLVAGCQNTIIPHSVMSIGDAAFSECSSLNSIIIPNSVTTLGCSAFYGCVSLTSIGIPSSITKIGVSAFSGCYYLDTIYVEAINPPSLGAYIFYGNPSPVCVIPCGTLAAYEASDWASQVGSFVEDCVEGQQIYYTSTDGNIVTPYKTNVFGANIVSNEYKDGQGVITFDGPVTSIGDYAFYECSALTSITIPSSVKSIGYLAFVNCSSLPFVTIPNSVMSIGEGAFHGCDSLTYITIPNSVTSIGEGAFGGCSSLTSMVVESGNANYDSRENCNAIIETTTNTLIAGCQNTIIPNRVTSIATHAFSGRSSLISITIPKSVVSIGSSAFWGCSSLTSITIPNSVESIGNHAFVNCSSLDTIYVEAATPPTLGENVFYGTPSPICVIPCGTLAAYEASDWANYMGEFVEEGCASIQMCGDDLHWEYADGVLTITGTGDMYDYAKDTDVPWYDVRGNIKTVSLPDAMTKIGQNAFYKCTAMTSINMPTSLTAIGEKAFAQDTRLACEIILPASMTTIASRAFFNCQAVNAFHIEATTPPTIPNDAFERTTAPIHVPCGYGHIYGKHTQWGMLNLEMCELLQDNVYYYPIDGHTARAVTYHSNPTDTIVIPSAVVIDGMPRTVTEVADFAFTDCKDIPAIIFNEGLEYIGERAFVRCYGLQGTIVLPATLETIGERAFSYCDNVEKYLIQAMTPPALGANVFTGDNKNALFYISCEAMDDYKVATNWSSLKSRLRDACLNIYHYNTPLGTNGVYTTEDTLVASIYYRRQFTPYRWETLYLPFEVDRVTVLEDGVEYDLTAWDIFYGGHYFLAKPDGMLNKEILFGFTDELASHTPYIIQFSDAYYTDKLITFYGKESWNKLSTSFEVLSSSAWMQIAGNTTMQDQLLEKPVYMLRSGLDFILQKTTTTLHPFECYVMPYTAQSGAPARMNVRFRGDVPTTVESVKGNESHLTYTIDGYTLTVYPQGQAFSIYSLNGALIYSCEAGKEAVDCELNSGCYLLHAGAEAHKIML